MLNETFSVIFKHRAFNSIFFDLVHLFLYFSLQFTAQIPNRPEFPEGSDIRSCIALGSRTKPLVQWFVFRNEPTMMDWIRSISDTVRHTTKNDVWCSSSLSSLSCCYPSSKPFYASALECNKNFLMGRESWEIVEVLVHTATKPIFRFQNWFWHQNFTGKSIGIPIP